MFAPGFFTDVHHCIFCGAAAPMEPPASFSDDHRADQHVMQRSDETIREP
jgi:hypothetical protein